MNKQIIFDIIWKIWFNNLQIFPIINMRTPLLLIIILPILARLCYTDIRSKELENLLILLILPLAAFEKCSLRLRLYGMILPFLLIYFFGFGDILLLSALGFVFGIEKLALLFIISSILSGMFCLFLLLSKKASKNKKIAYAPFICIGVIIIILCF